MTAEQFRLWYAATPGARVSGEAVQCRDLAEAEAYVRDFPLCCHGFATCGAVELRYTRTSQERLREALQGAGYRRSSAGWTKEGFRAVATWSDATRHATIHVYAASAQPALS